jgi:Ca-activated chloride channel family protein
VCASLAATLLLVHAQDVQGPTFKTGTKIVSIYATVVDSTDRLQPDLTRDDFEILDNGLPQPIVVFDNSIQPISVVVMLDTSASMTGVLDFVRKGAEQFLMRLLPQDKGRVGAFNDKIEFNDRFTSNRDVLIAALKDLDFGYPTRLHDAIDASITELLGIDGRRVVLILTDGEDTGSRASQGKVLDRARDEDVMVYGIGLQTEYFNGQFKVRSAPPERTLRRWAEETGGGFFRLQKTDALTSTFTRIAQELHSQYVLGFTPQTLDGKVHKIELRVKRPGMRARARKSYVAAFDNPATPITPESPR